MSCKLDVIDPDDIRELTENYWEYVTGDNIECYMEVLLGKELLHAQNHSLDSAGKIPRLRKLQNPVHTLALTVGESFEPLLQVICVLQPKRLILILNHHYGGVTGEEKGKTFKRHVERLSQQELVEGLNQEFQPKFVKPDITCHELTADSPADVFRALQKTLGDEKSVPPDGFTNAVDVTGSKKSMVVGAFLFAAHSGLPITYVDFDEYNADKRRPYGYKCRIGAIEDPYTAFRLRDWEQVRRLYNSFNFRSARELLGTSATEDQDGSGILAAMTQRWQADVDPLPGRKPAKASPLFSEEAVEATERLVDLLHVYELWENGDYAGAKLKAEAAKLPDMLIPWAVRELGGIWPKTSDADDAVVAAQDLLEQHRKQKYGDSTSEESLFAKPTALIAYIHDEKKKIGHLIRQNEDYRSALLRAAGLNEFLLKARICLSFLHDKAVVLEKTIESGNETKIELSALSAECRHEVFKAITKAQGNEMRSTLGSRNELKLGSLWSKISRFFLKLLPGYSYCETLPALVGLIAQLRNESIHTHLYIPRSLAEGAEEAVQEAVKEFEQNWLKQYAPHAMDQATKEVVSCPAWGSLCGAAMLNLDFLPPALRSES